ncbi:hypothetical protein XJ32_07675 [Helicobacter bilis]|uniref:Thioredoxin domain-containing protein n=1 Tax=Helicobacter bilis TaxID=37372 RepID=A0A1Q2LHU8_9HELI|nr:hypothetical protein [Helicobacter bilis]AQQ59988.1 hypothetical protein XJ32_07675 [Helicobacter bilis]
MREFTHTLLYAKSSSTYLFVLCFGLLIALFGCSDTDDNKTSDSKTESYDFTNISNSTTAKISLQHVNNKIQLHITNTTNKQSMLSSNAVKLFAFFPKDCSMCMPTFIHINNLLHRSKNLQVFILSKQAIHANSYRDFPITLSQNLVNLVDTNNKLDLFLDSLKRTLNIEIRDYQAPLFILQDTHNNIIQSIEGAVLEEIFEQMITELLTQDNKIDSNKPDSSTTEKTPNNTLSQSAPSSTESLQSK